MVLQRQVPARPAAKAGDGFSAGDTAGGNRSDAFSAALSQEQRSSTAEREKAQSVSQSDIDNQPAETGEQEHAKSAQSDEILNLLSGLKSSASYADDAELGKSGAADDLAFDAQAAGHQENLPETEDALAEEDAELIDAVDEAEAKSELDANGPLAVTATDAAGMASAVTVSQAPARPVATDRNVEAQTRQAASGQVPDPALLNKAEGVTAKGAADAKASTTPAQAATATAASGLAGQTAQLQPRTSEPTSRTDAKDPSAVKEAMRALGVGGEAGAVNVDAAKAQTRDRNAGRQDGADDRRIDDLAGKKDGKVEVIESRRFIPVQNLSANAQMLTRSLAEASSNALAAQRAAPAQALAQTGAPQTGQTLHTLKLQLNPISLGSITAVLKLSGEDLSVEIKVQTAEAYRQISDDNQSILKALRGQGFGVEQISVQHVVGNDRASGQSAQPGFQSSQQGPGSNDAQSFSRDGERNSAGQQQSGSRGGQSHEQGSYTGSGAGRTDGVYL